MLPKTWLVIAFILLCGIVYGQADSLFWAADSLLAAKADKTEIETWLDMQRVKTELSSAPLHADFGDYYQNAYFHIGRPGLNMPYRCGFQQFSSIFGSALYHSYFRSFYRNVSYYHAADYNSEPYPYAPALSSIDASLGDYEHHYARVNFSKGHLLSYSGLAYQGDLLVQNGWWTDLILAETSMKHQLSLDVGSWKLETEYATWAKDIAMTELLPVYWLPSNYKINHEYTQLYASVQNPWLKLGFINSKEKASAYQFAQILENKVTQLQLSHGQNRGNISYEAGYEHAWQSGNSENTGSFNADNYRDKLYINWNTFMPWSLAFKAEYLDFKRGTAFADFALPIRGHALGAFGMLRLGSDLSPVSVMDLYSLQGELELLDLSTRREQGLYFRYEWQGVSSLICIGSKELRQHSDSPGFSLTDELPFLRLAMDINHRWRNWELQARPSWIYSDYNPGLCENPEYRFSSLQNLYYRLPYNNAVVGGFLLQGHSGYYAANVVNPSLIAASTALDAWVGFDIDRWFQLRAGFKNILSSSLYGAFPVPLSAFAQLKWYYLN